MSILSLFCCRPVSLTRLQIALQYFCDEPALGAIKQWPVDLCGTISLVRDGNKAVETCSLTTYYSLVWTLTHWRWGAFKLLNCWWQNYFFFILARPVYKMLIIHEPNMLELWNKLHFEKEEKNGEYIPCLKYSVPIFVE